MIWIFSHLIGALMHARVTSSNRDTADRGLAEGALHQ